MSKMKVACFFLGHGVVLCYCFIGLCNTYFVSVVRNFGEFEHKMCYNSAFIIDISKIFASKREFSGSDNQIVSFEFHHNQPLLPW